MRRGISQNFEAVCGYSLNCFIRSYLYGTKAIRFNPDATSPLSPLPLRSPPPPRLSPLSVCLSDCLADSLCEISNRHRFRFSVWQRALLTASAYCRMRSVSVQWVVFIRIYIYIYIYMYRRTFVFETFLFPFVTFQVSRDFDLKFEKWEKGDFVERLLGVFVLF